MCVCIHVETPLKIGQAGLTFIELEYESRTGSHQGVLENAGEETDVLCERLEAVLRHLRSFRLALQLLMYAHVSDLSVLRTVAPKTSTDLHEYLELELHVRYVIDPDIFP